MRLQRALSLTVLLVITSLPVFAQWQWGRPREPRAGACFYRDPGFRGYYFCMREGERWPSLPSGFNDRISAIRVFGRARLRVFNDTGFRGISVRIAGDVGDLRELRLPGDPSKSWSDRISSIAVFGDRDEWEERHR